MRVGLSDTEDNIELPFLILSSSARVVAVSTVQSEEDWEAPARRRFAGRGRHEAERAKLFSKLSNKTAEGRSEARASSMTASAIHQQSRQRPPRCPG